MLVPFVLTAYLLKHFHNLKESRYLKMFGEALECLDLESKKSCFFYFMYMLRRMILALLAVYWNNNTGAQIIVFFYATLAHMIFYA